MNLTVLAINVWNNAGDARRVSLLNSELRRIAPDLVAFEEVIKTPEYSQLEELLDGTGLHGTHQLDVVTSAPPWIEHYGGSAVATRWPHRVAEVIDSRLPDAMDVPWATMAVSVPIPDEGELLFISASTSWRLDAESARERQTVALADLDARHRGPLPTIIAGDFNATPDAASIRYLTGLQSI
jgi:endonuclease/exonuclease/phosphatase (EEP) superfamily protein YafD